MCYQRRLDMIDLYTLLIITFCFLVIMSSQVCNDTLLLFDYYFGIKANLF